LALPFYRIRKKVPALQNLRVCQTEEFKRDAVRLANERGNVAQVARDLGIHASLLSKWKKRLETAPERPFPGQGNPHDLELAQRKRENARLKEENEILKRL